MSIEPTGLKHSDLETVNLNSDHPPALFRNPPPIEEVHTGHQDFYWSSSFASFKQILRDCYNLSALFLCVSSIPSPGEKDDDSSESLWHWIQNRTYSWICTLVRCCLSEPNIELTTKNLEEHNEPNIELTTKNLEEHKKIVGTQKSIESDRFLK